MAAGFMQWDNAFFPWTLNYDEIDMILEGELHVRHEGETMIAKAGDVMFIPKGSSIEFGTPSTVKFLYVALACELAVLLRRMYEGFHYRSMAQSESYAQRRG